MCSSVKYTKLPIVNLSHISPLFQNMGLCYNVCGLNFSHMDKEKYTITFMHLSNQPVVWWQQCIKKWWWLTQVVYGFGKLFLGILLDN